MNPKYEPENKMSLWSYRKDATMSELNDKQWPVAPIYISNATQHDLTDAQVVS